MAKKVLLINLELHFRYLLEKIFQRRIYSISYFGSHGRRFFAFFQIFKGTGVPELCVCFFFLTRKLSEFFFKQCQVIFFQQNHTCADIVKFHNGGMWC